MTTASNQTHTTSRIILVMAMVLFTAFGAIAQTVTAEPAPPAVAFETVATTPQPASANLNFVSWFMGTKQNTNTTIQSAESAKKQMIQSGIAPNRLLMKTFMKKAATYASNIA